jgi:hypothetical protein
MNRKVLRILNPLSLNGIIIYLLKKSKNNSVHQESVLAQDKTSLLLKINIIITLAD